MPPNVPSRELRHLQALVGTPANKLTQLISRQGLEKGEKGAKGEPGKVEPGTPETAVVRTTGTPHKSAFAATVYLPVTPKLEKLGYEIKIGGVAGFTLPATLLTAASLPFTHTITVDAEQDWEVDMIEGSLSSLESSYQPL